MPQSNPIQHQANLFGNDLLTQLNPNDPLILLANKIPWKKLENSLLKYYKHKGRNAKPIRLMAGLLILKSLENLSDERIVLQWSRNPYYQYFCGFTEFQTSMPCHSTDLVYFRDRIGKDGVNKIFAISVELHDDNANEKDVIIDSTVQEKNITYPTDGKFAIKIVHNCIKVAKKYNIKLRRTYVKEIKEKRIALRNFKHPRKKAKAVKAMKRLRTIALTLIRDLKRKMSTTEYRRYKKEYITYLRVLKQTRYSKNKIYSLHETHIYAIAKGKDHKKYEYGTKASICMTKTTGVIVGVVAHEKNIHDSKTLPEVLEHAHSNRTKPIKQANCDRGYAGCKEVSQEFNNKIIITKISIPGKPLKRDTNYQKQKKRKDFRRRAAIEPVIGHMKSDYRLNRNFLKGFKGDEINLLMSAVAWNFKKWINIYFYAIFIQNKSLLIALLLVLDDLVFKFLTATTRSI
jgi:IS5 family transposase